MKFSVKLVLTIASSELAFSENTGRIELKEIEVRFVRNIGLVMFIEEDSPQTLDRGYKTNVGCNSSPKALTLDLG